MAGALLAAPTVHAEGEAVQVGSLALDGTLFWEGEAVGAAPIHSLPFGPSNSAAPRCTLEGNPCQHFEFEVLDAGAHALRLGFDTPERDDAFEITVVQPSGQSTVLTNPNSYSVESSFPSPAVGVWRVSVAPYSAEDAPFRMRAKLESARYVPTPDAEGLLLPNLVVTRTWEFGFAAPVNPLNGPFLAPDDANPPASAGGFEPLSCSPDETVDDGATRCLRYSFALGNAGAGPFDLRWTADQTSTGHDVFQCLARADGTVAAHEAGTGSYHATHGHWHYDDVVWHRLYSLAADGTLTPAGDGKKIGYSPADQGIVRWDEFTQDRAGTSASAGSCVAGANRRLGLSRGWGDAYRYQRAGNYVDFNVNNDGEYVVHTVVDPTGHLRETDDSDNVFYTHIRVTGNDVEVLESGYGDSPLDPDKRVVTDWWTD